MASPISLDRGGGARRSAHKPWRFNKESHYSAQTETPLRAVVAARRVVSEAKSMTRSVACSVRALSVSPAADA